MEICCIKAPTSIDSSKGEQWIEAIKQKAKMAKVQCSGRTIIVSLLLTSGIRKKSSCNLKTLGKKPMKKS